MHHIPVDGEIFVDLDENEYVWRDGGLVQVTSPRRHAEGAEIDLEVTPTQIAELAHQLEAVTHQRNVLAHAMRNMAAGRSFSRYRVRDVMKEAFPDDPTGSLGIYRTPLADGTIPPYDPTIEVNP